MTHCRQPFAHDADSCVCQPSQLDLAADRFNRNAGERKSLGHQTGRAAQFVFIAVISFVVLFSAGFSIAAVVNQGHENLKTWMVANEPT